MACKDCGHADCNGDCDVALLGDLDDPEVTGVFSFKDRAIRADDFNRLEHGDFDLEVAGVAEEMRAGELIEIDLDIDDLIEDEPEIDPYAGPLVMLDGTVEERTPATSPAPQPAPAPPISERRPAQPPADARPAQPPADSRPAAQVPLHARYGIPIVVSLGRVFLKRWGFSKRPITIGRDTSQDIVLDGSLVSRHHCEIRNQDGADVVVDMGSSNGTTVNGHVMPSATLTPGTVIGVGKFYLFYGPTPNQLAYLQKRAPIT